MAAVGYAMLPVVPSFEGISRKIEKEISQPLTKASKSAGEALEKGVGKNIEQLSDRAEKAQYRQKRATEELAGAQSKLEQETLKNEAAQKRVERAANDVEAAQRKHAKAVDDALDSYTELAKSGTASAEELAKAEQKITDARNKGASDVSKKEETLLRARASLKSQSDKTTAAEEALADAQLESATAASRAEQAANELAKAQKNSASEGQKAASKLDTFKASAEKVGSGLVGAAEKLKVHAAVVGGAISGLAGVSMAYASEAEQSYGAVESIFGRHADVITQKSKQAADAVGLSGREYRELSSLTGAMLKNMGMPMEEVTDRTQDLVEVASDLSATFGGTTKDAIESVNALLRGEADPIEKYGVSIKKADVNARLAAKGLNNLEGEALKQAEAQELLSMLTEQTASAQGQFAREVDTAAHKQQVATAKLDDAKEVIGTALLPVMADLADMAGRVAEKVGEHPKLFMALAGAAAALAGGIVVLGSVAPIFSAISAAAAAAGTSMWGYVTAQAAAIAPALGVVAAVGAVVAALTLFFTKTELGRKIWSGFVDVLKSGVDRIKDIFGTLKQAVEDVFSLLFAGEFSGESDLFGLGDESSRLVQGLLTVRDAVVDAWGAVKDFAQGIWDSLQPALSWIGDFLRDSLSGTLGSLWEALQNVFGALMEVGKALGGAVLNVLKGFFGALKQLWDFLAPVLVPVLKVLAGIVGGVLVGAFLGAVKVIEGVAKVISWLAEGFRWLVENAIAPLIEQLGQFVGFLVSNLIPVLSTVAGFIRDVVVGAWNVLYTAIQWAWENVIQPVFNALAEVGQWVAQVLLTLVFTPIVLAWEALSAGIQWAWENVIRPAWEAVLSFATETLWPMLQQVFQFIKDGFHAVGNAIQWVWANVIKPVWDAIAGAANWLWGAVLMPVFDLIKAAFHAVGNTFRWVYDNLLKPVVDAFASALNWLWGSVINPVIDWIRGKWDGMGRLFGRVKDFIVDNVFGGIQSGLDTLKGWFNTVVGAIETIWSRIKRITAKPARFVVETVYNNGIRNAWNAVAKFTGLDELQPANLGKLGAYARGGVLPGYTPGKDVHQFYSPTGGRVDLSGGEAIMRPEWVRAMGGKAAIDAMNKAAISGGVNGVRKLLGSDPGSVQRRADGGVLAFKDGGLFPNGDTDRKEDQSAAIQRALAFMRREAGKPYQWGGVGNPSWDCSGLWSGIVHELNGQDGRSGRLFNTNSLIANPGTWGFKPGLSGPVTVGVSTDHMAGTLSGLNAESRSGDGVLLGGSAWGSENGYFPYKYTLASILGEYLPGAEGGGSGFNLSAVVKGIWDGIIDKLPKFDGADTSGLIGRLPAEMLKKLAASAWDFVKEKIGSFFGAGGVAGNAESWREMAVWAMRRTGFNADDPAQVNAMLAQIQSESGGIPDRNQEIVDVNGTGASAGQGLLQIIPGTFAAHRDPDLPNDRTDPQANMVAALRYYRATYGDDLTTMWGHGHGYARGGVLPGFTPGRDVHRFYSPTGGALALSGGESIMVPEWTQAVGGPAAVAAMNRAASGGRAGNGIGFAAGGVWSGARGFSQEELVKAVRELTKQIQKAADPKTLEGVIARAGASQVGEILGMLDMPGISSTISTLVSAEKELVEARDGHTQRLADIAAKEKALEEARKAAGEAADAAASGMSEENKQKLEDAQKAVDEARSANDAEKLAESEKKLADVRKEVDESTAKDAEKRAEDVTKANEQVTKAEEELAEARRKSAAALDMKVFDVAPQIHGALKQAAAATMQVPQVSQALAGLAAAAGPAGMSVGMAVQAVKTFISTVKSILTTIGDFVAKIFTSQAAAHKLMVDALNTQYEWAKTIDDMKQKIVDLRVQWAEAQVSLRDATWKTRLAQADVVRAQLQGAKSVAEAEAALQAERERVARAAKMNLNDLSLAYDRYRWAEYQGIMDRLDLATVVTPEILALEAEVNAAKLNALASQREASLSALQASWEQQKAALNLIQVQQNLATMTQNLALMSSELGLSQGQALQAMNTRKLYEEKAGAQSQIGKNFWRLSYWLTGAGSADVKRIKELDRLIAEREAAGKGAGSGVVKGTGAMGFFGYGDSASNAVKNAGYGELERKQWEYQEQLQLQQIEQQREQLEQQIEQNKLYVEFQKRVGELTAEIEALRSAESSAKHTAEYYREENPAIKAANKLLAEFEAGRAREYMGVARGEKQVVEITIPQQDTYTREQVDGMLDALGQVSSIDARVRRLEAPAKPGAAAVMTGATR